MAYQDIATVLPGEMFDEDYWAIIKANYEAGVPGLMARKGQMVAGSASKASALVSIPILSVNDVFTDTDGVHLHDHTIGPVNIPSASWATVIDATTHVITSNKANGPSSAVFYSDAFDSGLADFRLTATLVAPNATGTNQWMGLTFRMVDKDNYWLIAFSNNTDKFSIVEYTAAVKNVRAIDSALVYTAGATYYLEVVCCGSKITARIAGAYNSGLSYTSSAKATATKIGISTYLSSASITAVGTYDNLKVVNLAGGAAPLDGYSLVAESGVASGMMWAPGMVPVGTIIIWSGAVAAIPTGWSLCNGSGGTPDLRGRFVPGAGAAYAVGDTGGAMPINLQHNHTVDANTGSQADHTHPNTEGSLTNADSSHSHTGGATTGGPSTTGNTTATGGAAGTNTHTHTWSGTSTNGLHTHNTGDTSGAGGTHTHTTGMEANALLTNYSVAYYALAFIQRTS